MPGMPPSEEFYARLAGFADFTAFTRREWYHHLPADWFVVITDVQGSTQAIHEGRYKEVNGLGAASIMALLNAVTPLTVPYVFGGDGATVCIPPSKRAAVASALVATKQMAQASFGLPLRIGMVPMGRIREDGREVRVGKFQPSLH